MIVCDCLDIKYEQIKEAVKKYGDNLEAIIEETEAGTACEACLEDDCDKVGPFKNLCQSGKITNTQGKTHEDRSRCRAICS